MMINVDKFLPKRVYMGFNMKQKIFIAEDEEKQLDILVDYFESENYDVKTAKDGISAVRNIMKEKPDIIILDIMMPGMNGFDVCREIKSKGVHAPVIMLTAKADEVDKITGLELGADDYVTKPFSLRELHARIRARLRGAANEFEPKKQKLVELSSGKKINFLSEQVEAGDEKITLSKMEIALLKYFISNSNIILTRYDTIRAVWGQDFLPESRVLDAHIVNLRKKIEDNYKKPEILLTVHGRGYKFKI